MLCLLASFEAWILLACALLGVLWLHLKTKWQYLERLGIPHDPPSILQCGNARSIFYEPFTIDNRNKAKYGSVWGFYLVTAPHIVVHDAHTIRKILHDEFECFPARQTRTSGTFGQNDGLNSITGSQWKRIRSTLSPTFPPKRMEKMAKIIGLRADDAVQSLEDEMKPDGRGISLDGKDSDLYRMFSRLALDSFCSAGFGKETNFLDENKRDPNAPRAKKAKHLIDIPAMVILFAIYLFPFLGRIIGKIMRLVLPRKSEKFFFQNLCRYIIQRRQREPRNGDNDDILKLMLRSAITDADVRNGAQKGLTKREIFANSMVLVLGGYENPGNQIAFLAYNLAQHPDIQRRAQKEIDDMMKLRGGLDYESMAELKFLDMCLNETLRLYTPIARISRICHKEVTINGVEFPKGVFVEIPAYALAHDADYWDEPYEFKPERMADMAKVDDTYFQPFGGGPRKCLGIPYAKTWIKITMCKLLARFNIEPSADTPRPPLELKLEMNVRPVNELKLRLVPRARD